jgi:protein TonB
VQPAESDTAAISDAAGTAAQVRIALEQPRIAGLASTPAAPVRDLIATQALPASTPALDAALTVDAPARIHVVAPVYPPNAMASGVEGNVELEYSIGNDGGVQNIRVLRAQPAGVFDAAAQAALSLWQFAQPGEGAAGARYVQNFAFTLHRKAHNDAPKCQQVLGSLVCRHLDE